LQYLAAAPVAAAPAPVGMVAGVATASTAPSVDASLASSLYLPAPGMAAPEEPVSEAATGEGSMLPGGSAEPR
jgi:hypothetical protein